MTKIIAPVVAASVMDSIVSSATVVAKGKVENYSAAVTSELLVAYASGNTVEQLAAMFGKTARSIVAKLSKEKVYTKKAYVSKATGDLPTSKEQHVATIAAFMGVKVDELASLDKANKTVLMLIEATLIRMAHLHEEVK